MPIAKTLVSLGTAGVLAGGLATQFSPRAESWDAQLLKPIGEIQSAALGAVKNGLAFLSTTIRTVVPYELPEFLSNGDIIIRHVPPSDEAPPPVKDLPSEPQTKA